MKNKKPKLVYQKLEENDLSDVRKRTKKFVELILKANIEFQYGQMPMANEKELEAVWSQIRHSERALKNIEKLDDAIFHGMYIDAMSGLKSMETLFTIGGIAYFFDVFGGKVLENEPNG